MEKFFKLLTNCIRTFQLNTYNFFVVHLFFQKFQVSCESQELKTTMNDQCAFLSFVLPLSPRISKFLSEAELDKALHIFEKTVLFVWIKTILHKLFVVNASLRLEEYFYRKKLANAIGLIPMKLILIILRVLRLLFV